jgi:hypothetical protein
VSSPTVRAGRSGVESAQWSRARTIARATTFG